MHSSYLSGGKNLPANDEIDLPISPQQTVMSRNRQNGVSEENSNSNNFSSSVQQNISGIEYLGTAAFFHEALQSGLRNINFTQFPPNVLPVVYDYIVNALNSYNSQQIPNVGESPVVDLSSTMSNFNENCLESTNSGQNYVSETEMATNFMLYQSTPPNTFAPYSSKSTMSSMVDAVLAHEQEQQNNLRLPNFSPLNFIEANRQNMPDQENNTKFLLKTNSEISPPTPSTASISETNNVLSMYDDEESSGETTDDDDEIPGTSSLDDEIETFTVVDCSKKAVADAVGRLDYEAIKRRYRADRLVDQKLLRIDQRRKKKMLFASIYNQKRKSKIKTLKNPSIDNVSDMPHIFPVDEELSKLVEIKIQEKSFPFVPSLKLNGSSPAYPDLVDLYFANLRRPSISMLRNNESNVKMFKKGKRKRVRFGKVQQHVCHDLNDVTYCLECAESRHTTSDTDYCRFMDFRMLRRVDNTLQDAGFVTYNEITSKNKIHQEFLPPNVSTKTWSVHTACFVLSNIYHQFKALLEREETFLSDCLRWNFVRSPNEALPWRDAFNVRELCDVCSTTIFNLHLICNNCGLSLCMDCVYARLRRETRVEIPSKNQDHFGWSFCSTKHKKQHCPDNLRLAQLIPDANCLILSTLQSLNRRVIEQLGRYSLMNSVSFDQRQIHSDDAASSPHWYMFDGAILVLKESKNAENLSLFQKHWKTATPVVVENVAQGLNLSYWQPSVMKVKCQGQASSGSIVDCRTGSVIDNLDAGAFWDGFIDCHRRVKGLDDRKLYLKLKDWPPAEKFSNVLPEHFEDLCDSLPIPEYTHPRFGAFNLATNLPSFCVEPDLGPKIYTAYEMIFEPNRGTTNLHMDISCAVNILVTVTTPINVNANYLYENVLKHLEVQGLDPKDLERAIRNPDKIGALWTIFRPEDSEAIRSFLFELAEEQRKDDFDDPIHDQMCYLHVQLRKRLEIERGVKGFTFVQMLGDAVFIPAGAAHQVQNMLCCIKVAEDFVSPEGVFRCAAVAGEFRNLTKQHSNHEDKLQLPNIVLHSVREAVRTLELNEPTSF